MSQNSIDTIVICGGGLAGYMCATALANILPHEIAITLVDTPKADKADMFYGTVTAPTVYKFLTSINITEPELILNSNTSFSFGTLYQNWGGNTKPWVQSHHLPLLPINGVGFHHFITRRYLKGISGFNLEPYLISTQAVHCGTFAHPPSEQNIPLARAENGYHFAPDSWTQIFAKHIESSRVVKITSAIADIQTKGKTLTGLKLSDGQTLTADLFIDCTGPEAELLSSLSPKTSSQHTLRALASRQASKKLDGVCRTLKGTDFGWQSKTPLQGETAHLTIYHPSQEDTVRQSLGFADDQPLQVKLGHKDQSWVGNCVAIGQAAAVIEPLTPAPMMLLQRDIERLLELIPVSKNMNLEEREFNRRFSDDITSATLFQRAFFETPEPPETAYFHAARERPVCDKLIAKLEQFKSRGIFVQYDNEIFNEQDWMILHFGIGRIPKRYDPLTDCVPEAQVEQTFQKMRSAIKHMAHRMPPHDTYMSKLQAYLKENHVR